MIYTETRLAYSTLYGTPMTFPEIGERGEMEREITVEK
jgi:hypothetical protein